MPVTKPDASGLIESGPCSEAAGIDWRQITLVILVAAVLRLIWAWMIPVIPLSDGNAYAAFARTMAEHGVFGWTPDEPFAFWPPGTTFLHAAMYAIFGPDNRAIVGLNIAISLAIIVTSVRLADRFFGARVATATAVLLALWPTLIMYCTVLASELPFLFLTILALDLWTVDSAEERGWWKYAAAAGVLLGFASLVRPLALLLPAVYGGSLFLQREMSWASFLHQFKFGVVSIVLMAVVIAPWTLRNYDLYGEPVLISTNGGITFWMGNAPGSGGSHLPIPPEYAHLSDNEQARVLGDIAMQHIKEDPSAFLVRSIRKVVILLANESIGVVWNEAGIRQSMGDGAVMPLKRFTQITWALIFFVALYGLLTTFRKDGFRRAASSVVLTSTLYFIVIHSVIVAQDRYHLSFAAQVAMYFAIGILALVGRFGGTVATWLGANSQRSAHE